MLKMMPDIYENADEVKIIEMLQYRDRAYKDLKILIEYAKTSDDIKTFFLKREEYLYDERAKKLYKFLKSKNDNIYEWP